MGDYRLFLSRHSRRLSTLARQSMPILKRKNVMKYERKVTSAERFFSLSPFSIVTMVARVKGSVTEEMLKNAVAKVQQRHTLLNVRIKEDDEHTLWFTSDGVQDIPIQVVARKSDNDWIKIHAEASKLPFPFETRPAIRFILVHSPDVSELIILCHHTICDGMSLAYLARDLMVYLGDSSREVEVLPAPLPIDLNNLPGDVKQPGLVKFLINRMNQQWTEESVCFDQEDYRTLTQAYWHTYTHEILPVELSEEETSFLVSRCRKEGVTVNSALTAAFTGAQNFVEGPQPYHKQIVVAASLRGRIPHPAGEAMGMYAGGVELNFPYNQRRSFWDNARIFHKKITPKLTNKILFGNILNWLYLDPTMFEAMHFKKLGGLVPSHSVGYAKLSTFSEKEDVVWKILKRDHLESLKVKHWGTAVTNLGRLDFPITYGDLVLDRLILQPGGGIALANAFMVLGAVTCSGKLSLVLEYAEQAVDTATMEKIKDKAMEYLLNE
jgi:NRPS condensation-like uncharacterized protein